MNTRDTGGRRVVFHTAVNRRPVWDPDGYLTADPKFTDPADLVIDGDYDGTLKGWDSSDDASPEYPRLGRPELDGSNLSYTISVEGRSAKLYVDCFGNSFTGDKYVVYDYDDDVFYWKGTSDIVTHINLYDTPERLQPTPPRNFVCTNSGSVGQHPHFRWEPPTHPQGVEVTYNIYRDVGDGYHRLNTSPLTVTEYTDTGATILRDGNASYYYVTAAAAQSPESDPSNTVIINTDIAAKPAPRPTGDVAPSGTVSNESAMSLVATPNPFNASTVLHYHVAIQGKVDVRVFDASGRLVAVLTTGTQQRGTYRTPFDGSNLPSGVYIAVLSIGGRSIAQKLVLVK